MEEKTSKEVAAIAAKVLAGKPCTDAELKSLAASALTQAPDKPPDFESEADLADD